MTVDLDMLRAGLAHTLEHARLDGLGPAMVGKVRDAYRLSDGRRVLVTTDRISAFDRVLGTIPFKGQVLNRLSAWWFEATRETVPNHLLAVPDPNVTIAVDCTPLPVELVMRAYLTGVTSTSIWTHYEQGSRVFCGHPLPDGMRKHERLPEAILTPSTKAADGGHDKSVSRAELLSRGVVSEDDFDRAAAMAHALFRRGQEICAAQGIVLVDTKYEIGRTADGTLLVIDEVHTPDSSRFWIADSYEERFARGDDPEPFSKEYVREWLAEQGYRGDGPPPALPDQVRVEAARRYVEAAEAIMGAPLALDGGEPMPRIRRHLSDLPAEPAGDEEATT